MKQLVIESEFGIGEVVYLVVSDDPVRGQVTCILVAGSGLKFLVDWADGNSGEYQAFQLTKTFTPQFEGTE